MHQGFVGGCAGAVSDEDVANGVLLQELAVASSARAEALPALARKVQLPSRLERSGRREKALALR